MSKNERTANTPTAPSTTTPASASTETKTFKPWPMDCIWPEPITDDHIFDLDFDFDNICLEKMENDPFLSDLWEIKVYIDELVEMGILDENYYLIEDAWEDWLDEQYEQCEQINDHSADVHGVDCESDLIIDDLAEALEDREFYPKYGEDFWKDDHFDIGQLKYSMKERLYKQKLDLELPDGSYNSTVYDIQKIIGYDFSNENLLRQAFTRRSFAVEMGLANDNGNDGSSEELEFFGDRILEIVVTKELAKQFTFVNNEETEVPFETKLTPAQLTEFKTRLVCKEHLARRCEELALDRFILYGTGDEPNDNAKEDVIEALIGAVASDCDWNMDFIEDVVDRLINIQFEKKEIVIQKNMYDVFNAWHMRRFKKLPDYFVYKKKNGAYACTLTYRRPDGTKNSIDTEEMIRSLARSDAAERAWKELSEAGLWRTLDDSGIEPDYEKSINQWQELYQKKYVCELPEYKITRRDAKTWHCEMFCDTIFGWGISNTKVGAKKKAAYMGLLFLFKEAGITKPEWEALRKEHINSSLRV